MPLFQAKFSSQKIHGLDTIGTLVDAGYLAVPEELFPGDYSGNNHFIGLEALGNFPVGVKFSVAHTHVTVVGYNQKEFSGLGGLFSNDLVGDLTVCTLFGAEAIYMANDDPNSNSEIYECDSSGPVLDSNNQYNGYKAVGTY